MDIVVRNLIVQSVLWMISSGRLSKSIPVNVAVVGVTLFSLFSFTPPQNTRQIQAKPLDITIPATKPLSPKEVFLTFDDGPSSNITLQILDILKYNKVKATFFVIGSLIKENPKVLKTLKDSGMCIAIHSFSHNYNYIYKSPDKFMTDYSQFMDAIRSVLGDYQPKFYRLPGGSTNRAISKKMKESIRETLLEMNVHYVDWNSYGGDSDTSTVTAHYIIAHIFEQIKTRPFAVMLFHDNFARKTTMDALPTIIKGLKDHGYVFRTFDDITPAEIRKMESLLILDR